MTISVKTGSNYSQVSKPYYKTAPNVWTPLKNVYYKTAAGTWTEVWPQSRYYIHTGYGYQMDVAACFGNPTQPATYVFINNGYIGGALSGEVPGGLTNFALRIGTFPVGSTVIIQNNWVISGAGGDGASFYNHNDVYAGDYPSRQGGHGILVNFPIRLDNTNGSIRGGGGGGGAKGEWAERFLLHSPGGGGAGIPGGRANMSGWTPSQTGGDVTDYRPNYPGGEFLGGTRGPGHAGDGGDVGNPGERGLVNGRTLQRELREAGPGFSIYGMSNVTPIVIGQLYGPTA